MGNEHEMKSAGATETAMDKDYSTGEMDLEPQAHDKDMIELARQGKKQVLKRNFGFVSMSGFCCTVISTWATVLVTLFVGFQNGGPAGLVYGYIFIFIGTLASMTVLSELASMAPTAGGQYHWVSMLAPRSTRKYTSYIIGWLTATGWIANFAAGCFLTGTLIQGLVILNYPDYVPQPFHSTMFMWFMIVVVVLVNTVMSALLPFLETMMLLIFVLSFFGILIPLVYFAPHGSASEVFTLFLNEGGWSTQGLSFFVGLQGIAFGFIGADSVIHMCEEIRGASVVVPRAIVFSLLLNGTLGFGMLIAVLFCLGNISDALSTPTGYPFMEIFLAATQSQGGASAMVAVIVPLFTFGTIGGLATGSRMIWSFSRDRGMPLWRHLSKVDKRSTIPLYAIGLATIAAMLLSLITLGSTTALNDVVSLSVGALFTSYLISASLLLWRRTTSAILERPEDTSCHYESRTVPGIDGNAAASTPILTWGPWKLPNLLGIINNVVACCFLAIILFFSFWPPTTPTSGPTMNFSSLMLGSMILFATFYYVIWARKIYHGPVIEVSAIG